MRSTTFDIVLLTALGAALIYLSVYAWFGASGAVHHDGLRADIVEFEREIAEIDAQREALDAKSARLAGQAIDAELLDERLRAVFGVTHPDDVLLLPPKTP